MKSNSDYLIIDKKILNEWGLLNLLCDASQYHHMLVFEHLKKTYKNEKRQAQNIMYKNYHDEKIEQITMLIDKLKKEFNID